MNTQLELLCLFHDLLIQAKGENRLPGWLKNFSMDNDNKDGEIIFTVNCDHKEIVLSSNNFQEGDFFQ